jgi:thiamine pyrophosphate-dependent acetolactate synthase large subunit-like protein
MGKSSICCRTIPIEPYSPTHVSPQGAGRAAQLLGYHLVFNKRSRDALQRALRANRPVVIDVVTDIEVLAHPR